MALPVRLDHRVIHVCDRARSDAFYRDIFGARGRGTSIHFRDRDGSLLEFISYAA